MARQKSVVERKSFHDKAGNKVYLRIRLQPDGTYVVEAEHLQRSGGSSKGVMGHFEGTDPERKARARFNELTDETHGKGWEEALSRRGGSLTEIPPADNRERRRPGPQPGAARKGKKTRRAR